MTKYYVETRLTVMENGKGVAKVPPGIPPGEYDATITILRKLSPEEADTPFEPILLENLDHLEEDLKDGE